MNLLAIVRIFSLKERETRQCLCLFHKSEILTKIQFNQVQPGKPVCSLGLLTGNSKGLCGVWVTQNQPHGEIFIQYL